jgi:hypothetical protein
MDTLAPAAPRPPLPAPRPAIPAYESPLHRVIDTARRLQENVQNMPLTSLIVATVLGIGVGSFLTSVSHSLSPRVIKIQPAVRKPALKP